MNLRRAHTDFFIVLAVLLPLAFCGAAVNRLFVLGLVAVAFFYISNPVFGLYLLVPFVCVHTVYPLPQLPLLGYSDVFLHEAVIAFFLLLGLAKRAMHRTQGDPMLWRWYWRLVLLTLPSLYVGLKSTVWHNLCFRNYMTVLFVGATLMPQVLRGSSFVHFYRFFLFCLAAFLVARFGLTVWRVAQLGTLLRNPFYGSATMLMLVPLLVVSVPFIVQGKGRLFTRACLAVVLAAIAVLAFLSGGRGSSLALFLAVGITWLALARDGAALFGRILFLLLIAVTAIWVMATLDMPIVKRFLSGYANVFSMGDKPNLGDTATWRIAMYKDAINSWLKHPLLGVGWGGTIRGTHGYRFFAVYIGSENLTDIPQHVHNAFLGILAGGGLVGAAGFVLFVRYCASESRRGLAALPVEQRRPLRAVIVGAVSSFTMLLSTNALVAAPQIALFFLFIGIWLRFLRLDPAERAYVIARFRWLPDTAKNEAGSPPAEARQ